MDKQKDFCISPCRSLFCIFSLAARGGFSFSVKWLCAPRGRAGGAGQVFFFGQMACAPCGCACGVGQVFSFGQMALRSARGSGRAGFFFELVLALVARGMFSLLVKRFALRAGAPVARGRFSFSVKWLCAPRGPEVGRGDSKHPSLPLARAERKAI